ncbi:hypothetical protein CcrKarma_gp232 [Caulobacter virus Karma]|uniref:Uncharacterized protein n=6 Tax=Viruses TaxID=10239 RepID=K4K419_9CAUD|nr:hypothetical protein D865_gp198 [Caulobacter phage phiCbK]YP_006989612.1 hypothetical protein CcrKarma_gp232 [Caulobacter virus Karma]YP_006989960.1 hypothetical protein D870_gp194 [Caulobacter phage CcrSwift]ARB15133.1 hypothetical protein Ccr32_gp215 [Caulobacter phage Ccr32]ARB15467.1 hypothetical protein Ccr34_gp225 [Caulobacter phage Ccr34]AFO71615.1 hypothetical protein phiCbK_101 [Caulobacter phage phiCbK]AFU87052.1 hypothetical protein CbK_gp220 [Caulobacter phage phiCbK]AFU87749.
MIPLATHEHLSLKGKAVKTSLYLPITARQKVEVRGVCLAVLPGTYRRLAIIEFVHQGQTCVIDVALEDVALVTLTEAEASLLRAAQAMGEGGRLNVFNDHPDHETAKALNNMGYLEVVALGKSPRGPTIYGLTPAGAAASA